MTTVTGTRAREPEGFDPSAFDRDPVQLVGSALVVGLVLEVGLRGGLANGVVVVGIAFLVLLLVSGSRIRRTGARAAALLALVPALFLAVRASPWLVWSNAVAVLGLLAVSTLFSRAGSVFDTTPGRLLGRALLGMGRGIAGLAVIGAVVPRPAPERRATLARLARALAVAVPVLAVLVALLVSADAVFASLLTPEIPIAPVAGHMALTALVAVVVVAVATVASAPVDDHGHSGTFGVTEVVTMLGLVAAVLGLFVVSQLVALTGAGDRLVSSAGLTPAEYARSGFFQLCWATGLLLAFLAVVRALAAPGVLRHRLVVALGGVVPLLAVGLVVVSLRRMALYDRAFGLTMLRLWVVGAALWMGAVLVMTAIRNVRRGSDGNWLVAGAGLAGLALVLVADGANPEAFVARHNIERAGLGAELDVDYLSRLSDDAVPVVASDLGVVGGVRCEREVSGVAALNLAVQRAGDVRRAQCPVGAPRQP